MTDVAGQPRRMVGGMNLGEIHRLRVVRLMAPNAEHGGIELRGSGTGGIFCVLGLRSMTRFTGHPGMAPCLFQIQNVAVTGFADFVASKGNRLGHDFLQGVAPKVAVLAKALRDENASEHKEEDEAHQENGGHAKKVREVFGLNHSCGGPTKIFRTFVHIPCLRTRATGRRSRSTVI